MSEETTPEVAPVPIEQRIAAFVVHDALTRILKGRAFDAGHCEVHIAVFNELPENTPKDFHPVNDLETYLISNKLASDIKVTLPFSFAIADIVKGISSSMVIFEKTWNCTVSTSMKKASSLVQIEFASKTLKRSLYVRMTPLPGK